MCITVYLEASWMCQSWCPSCFQDFCASDLMALEEAHPNLPLPASHTGNMGNHLSFWEEQQWDLYIRGKQTITVKLVSDIVYKLLFITQFRRHHKKGNGPFLRRMLSGGEGAGEWPSIIHLKRDCCPPPSLSPAGPPTMGPNSRPERLTPGPNP